ncbi:MAG TPA: DUF2510 domain-containing protein [Mycobacterium sp.]|nr:DUF2510 domain-containing protein [Mycobacterium sp.]
MARARKPLSEESRTTSPAPGWYPDPSGAPGKRYFDGRQWAEYLADPPGAPRAVITPWPTRRRIPIWVWIAVTVVLVTVALAVGRLASTQREASPPAASSSTPAAPPPTPPGPQAPPHSHLVNITLPAGSTATGGQAVPGLEVWHVPLRIPDTVADLRPQLPINAPYDELPWCAETIEVSGAITRWTWGSAEDLLLIEVGPYYPTVGASADGTQVTISRHRDRTGVGCG